MGIKLNFFRWLVAIGAFTAQIAWSQAPPGYYNGTEGLSGNALRSALFNIISDHTELSFASIWTHFQSTDIKPDGTVWDMYSDIPGGNPAYTYQFVTDQCGSYSGEGDCYNREHSFPKSWFNDAPPMVTDLFQIYPTDGYVNGQRSNYAYGEVDNPEWTSTNGSKLGINVFPGYSGTVFEPIDEYKGDFARTYFYMLTCYMDQVSTWSSPMLSGDNLSAWAMDMLAEWSHSDPVSKKETDRNDAVFGIQENRNPFIDHPEWVTAIWGQPNGINHTELPKTLIWYSNGYIHLQQQNDAKGELQVCNLMGQQLAGFPIDQQSENIAFELPPGMFVFYFIQPEFIISKKITVKR